MKKLLSNKYCKMKFFFLFLIVFLGCNSSNHITYHPLPTNNAQSTYLLPESLFLENRLENCDSAIVYMKNVVLPMGLEYLDTITSMVLNPSVKYRIPGERLFLRNKDRSFYTGSYRFYISSSCFVGHPLKDVLDIFCTPKDKKMLLYNDQLVRDFGRKNWFINFSDGFGNLDGVVIDSNSIVSRRLELSRYKD